MTISKLNGAKGLFSNGKFGNGMLLILFTAIISGLSIFINSFAVKGFDSSVFTFAKNFVVAILLIAVVLGFRKFDEIKRLSSKDWWQLLLIGLVGGSIPFLLFFKGLQLANGTSASFIHKSMFIFCTILAMWLLREKINVKIIIGVGLVFVGTFFMIRPDFKFSIAHVYILGAVLLWSYENILAKKVLAKLSGTIVALGRMFFGSLFILLYLAISGKMSTVFSMNSSQYVWILFTAALLFGYVITYYNGLKTTSVTVATSILSLGAPITAMLSYTFTNATLTFFDALGMLLIVAGTLVLVAYSTIIEYFTGDSNKSATHDY